MVRRDLKEKQAFAVLRQRPFQAPPECTRRGRAMMHAHCRKTHHRVRIRDIPGHIYRRLAEQAEREHRSLAQQTLAVLSRGLGVEMDAKARRRKVLQAIAGMDHSPTKKLRAPARLIREDRNR